MKSDDKLNLIASSEPFEIKAGVEFFTGITCFDCLPARKHFSLYLYKV